jgi:hypothetical protein
MEIKTTYRDPSAPQFIAHCVALPCGIEYSPAITILAAGALESWEPVEVQLQFNWHERHWSGATIALRDLELVVCPLAR